MGGGGSRKRKSYARQVPHESYTSATSKGGIPLFDDCEGLNFMTEIVKPTAETAKLVLGDELLISLDGANNARLFNSAGGHCGNIIGKQVEKMVGCIRKGYDYRATVTEVGPPYKVRIRNKK